MLQYLKIRNLALLDEVTLELDSGFTAVTGETGAGKSVLLGALSLLSGGRSEKTMIRHGADLLEVEGAVYFSDSVAIDEILEAAGLPPCEEGVLLLQRRIHREKMPRIQINGSMATLAQLRLLGEEWIDFHGPGEPQKLFKERCQLEMLDLYAGNADRLASYRDDYEEWCVVRREIKNLETSEQLTEDEIDYLREQIRQIDDLQISESAIEALERDYARMASAQEFLSLASQCSTGLLSEEGLVDQLNKVVSQYETLVILDSDASSLLERVRSALLELQDLGEETERLANGFDFDAEAVEIVTEQMNLWQEVRRKFGGSVQTVIEKREDMAQKLASQGNINECLQEKLEAAQKMEETLQVGASDLLKIREKAARSLAEKATKLLLALGFKNARLAIEFIAEPELKEFGDSHCVFQFSPNAGQAPLPLNKIASSGEMARVMLALKTVLAEADATPLLVFDEVDANVGGEIGRSVGEELAKLSSRHQVLCVTHLPQVASLARNHFVVTKSQEIDSTNITIESIHESRDVRLDELARMLGDRNSNSARGHAETLLV
jgi:DNA repair protein RecN (Recombination protein N)